MRLPIFVLFMHNFTTMTWYFNNDGTADGPHDESAMLTLIQAGRVGKGTLIWHSGLDLWQEAGALKAAWWQQPVPPPAAPANLDGKASTSHRSPTPLAPTEQIAKSKSVGFLKRLFGRKDKP
jgi:hypothetical protein